MCDTCGSDPSPDCPQLREFMTWVEKQKLEALVAMDEQTDAIARINGRLDALERSLQIHREGHDTAQAIREYGV